MNKILNRLEEERIFRKIRKYEIAKSIGVTLNTYGNWTTGKTEPTITQVELIAEALDMYLIVALR